MAQKSKTQKRESRRGRIRSRVHGTAERPRLAVFKSNRNIYAQLIDDNAQETLAAASTLKTDITSSTEQAKFVGEEIAKQAKAKKISKVVFDRGGFLYTGNIATLAEAARGAGLEF